MPQLASCTGDVHRARHLTRRLDTQKVAETPPSGLRNEAEMEFSGRKTSVVDAESVDVPSSSSDFLLQGGFSHVSPADRSVTVKCAHFHTRVAPRPSPPHLRFQFISTNPRWRRGWPPGSSGWGRYSPSAGGLSPAALRRKSGRKTPIWC